MALGGILGNGTKVAYSPTSPVSWTPVGQLLEVDFPELKSGTTDTTVHSTSNFKRKMPTMIDVSAMTLTLEGDLDEGTSPSHDALWDYNQTKTTLWWRVEVPVDRQQTEYTAFEFQGFVNGFKHGTPIDDKQTSVVMVEFDGTSLTKYNAGASAIS